jgi:hypothetical protein
MVQVDDIGVPVLHLFVPMRMAMRLRPFPTLVIVMVVLIMDVPVLVFEGLVPVFQFEGIACRPEEQRRNCRREGHHGEHGEGGRQADRPAYPPRERIGDQPAGVRQGELRRVEGGAIPFMRGALEQPSRRGLDQRGAGAEQEPDRQQRQQARLT